jgi:phage-related protein
VKRAILFSEVRKYLDGISEQDSVKVLAGIRALEAGLVTSIRTKPLRGKIRELIVKMHRVVYFGVSSALYFVDAFLKKSDKTPERIIQRAETIYREIAPNSKI